MKPTPEQLQEMFPLNGKIALAFPNQCAQLRQKALELVEIITDLCPDSTEMRVALVHVEEAFLETMAGMSSHWTNEAQNG